MTITNREKKSCGNPRPHAQLTSAPFALLSVVTTVVSNKSLNKWKEKHKHIASISFPSDAKGKKNRLNGQRWTNENHDLRSLEIENCDFSIMINQPIFANETKMIRCSWIERMRCEKNYFLGIFFVGFISSLGIFRCFIRCRFLSRILQSNLKTKAIFFLQIFGKLLSLLQWLPNVSVVHHQSMNLNQHLHCNDQSM